MFSAIFSSFISLKSVGTKEMTILHTCLVLLTIQVIQIEKSQFSCPIRSEQPTEFPDPSSCVNYNYFCSLIFLSFQSADPLIVEHLFHLALGMTPNGSLNASAVVMYCLLKSDVLALNKFYQ